jgi:hypothetical protein
MDGDSNKKRRMEYQRRLKAHTERKKKTRGVQKDPLTQESHASDFDHIDGLEAQKAYMEESIKEIKVKLKSSKEQIDEHGKKETASNSKDNAIAID